MTEVEQKLWFYLRRRQLGGLRFYRQKPIDRYSVDFYCAQAKLVIELDGSQHYEPAYAEADRQRDGFLAGLGLRVLRIDDRQALLETDAVMQRILEEATVPPSPGFLGFTL